MRPDGIGRPDGPQRSATLAPTTGNTATGTATFSQAGDRVMVHARVSGLKPGQEHGFHVHEKGECSSGDGVSAGGHFNPTGKPHGPPDAADRHAGDLPALKADAQGRVDVQFRVGGISYFLVLAPNVLHRPAVRELQQWLVEQAGQGRNGNREPASATRRRAVAD